MKNKYMNRRGFQIYEWKIKEKLAIHQVILQMIPRGLTLYKQRLGVENVTNLIQK